MTDSDIFDPIGIPPEVLHPPQPLLGIMGLDIGAKFSHKSVWDILTVNRHAERVPLKFREFNIPVGISQMKPKRQSYEWYIPKGILKQNWFKKYLQEIPALFVLFWELDWTDSNWQDEKNKIVQIVKDLKTAIGLRGCRIAIVLIQSTTGSSVPLDDSGGGAAEKASLLCGACDLPPKHLFALPFSDPHLMGYVVRLENALNDIAGGFYLGETKTIKGHRDFLNKTNHQLLFIRHQIKLGFHNEMRNDQQTALKHYIQAYFLLVELRFTNTNLHEIRAVGAIVNYKICKINFALNLPRDAIEQFRRHIDNFRQRTGPPELIFEHYAWLSKQYSTFGTSFDDAVQGGLPAVQTQHPGFYFQLSAQYAILRRNLAEELCKDVSRANMSLLSDWNKLEFFGQRPWRAGKHSLEPPEEQAEQDGILSLSYHEIHNIPYSSLIIPQFCAAISQFKKYRCPRMQRYLMVQMAKEYQIAEDSAKGLALLNHVMYEYRQERWLSLLYYCLPLALQCAYINANISDYCLIALELMGEATNSEEAQANKKRVKENLFKIIMHESPDPEPNMTHENHMLSSHAWSTALQLVSSSMMLNLNDIISCLQIKIYWRSLAIKVNEKGVISVKIRNIYIESLKILSLNVTTSSKQSSDLFTRCDISISPMDDIEIEVDFYPSVQDMGEPIKITGVTLKFGISDDLSLNLFWTNGGKMEGSYSQMKEFKNLSLSEDEFQNLPVNLDVEVISCDPSLNVEVNHDSTSLVWEWLPLTILLKNNEKCLVSSLCVSINLEQGSETSLERTTQLCTQSRLEKQIESHLSSASISKEPLSNLNPGEETSLILYVKALTAVKRSLVLKVEYHCEIEVGGKFVSCPFEVLKSISITPQIPFKITVATQTMKFVPHNVMVPKEKFLVVPKIECSSHVPIEFSGSSITTASLLSKEGSCESQLKNVEVRNGDVATDCFCISLSNEATSGNNVSLGQYMLYWKRSGSNTPAVSVSISLPSITVENVGLWIDAKLPPMSSVRVPMTIAYNLTNTSKNLQEVSVSMQVSDAFMFSGHKEVRLRLLPGWSEKMTFTLYPLLAGYVQLPKICLIVDTPTIGTRNILDTFLQRILPTHIFIMPQEKNLLPDAGNIKESATAALQS